MCTQKKKEKSENYKITKKYDIPEKTVLTLHEDSDSSKFLNILLLRNRYRNTEEDRIEENIKFMTLMINIHGGSQNKTIGYLKNVLDPSVYKTLHEDNNPGLKRKKPLVNNISQILESDKLKWLRWLVVKAKRISAVYVDLFKDLFLGVSILLLMGGIPALIFFPAKMTSVVVICIFATIIIPMLLSSVILAIERIQEAENDLKLTQKINF